MDKLILFGSLAGFISVICFGVAVRHTLIIYRTRP